MSDDCLALLRALVRTPSPSGGEREVAALLAGWLSERGLKASADENGVWATVEGRRRGATLLLASHLDTVPPGAGWTVDPYAAVEDNGRLLGRGVVDAKASVAAMAAAAARVAAGGGPERGRLVLLASYGEETAATTMPAAVASLPDLPDAAIVGEPTGLAPVIAQRGQLLLRLGWRGDQLHAGWAAHHRGSHVNVIHRAAADLVRLAELELERRDDRLGRVVISPTMLAAGVARNVIPGECEAVLDIRTTPAYSHEELVALVARAVVAEVEVISDRLVPVATPPGSRLLAAIGRVRPEAATTTSPTCSDWVFLAATDTVKLGPGDSSRSHAADEWIEPAAVGEAATLYAAIVEEYLS